MGNWLPGIPAHPPPMILPSIFYFLFFAAIACLFPFLALFYQEAGLTGSQIGLLTGLSPLITLFATPLWTGAADATRRHKPILVVTIGGAIAMALVISRLSSFAWLLPALVLYALFAAPIVALTDSATMNMLGERKHMYGRVRLWGTIGWGAVAPLVGGLIERQGIHWSFYSYAILLFASLLFALRLPYQQGPAETRFSQGVRSLLTNRRWMLFLVTVFVCGVGMASVNNYLFIYMESLGASRTLMGVALTISTISEIPVMFFAERMLRRFQPRGMLVLAMTFIAGRLLLYSITSLPWAILAIQLLHGLTFAPIYIAGVAYADQVAPPGMKATTQGMFGSTLMGFGAAAGGLLGGFLIEQVGPAAMYRVIGIVVLAGMLLFLLVERRAGAVK